MTDLATKAPAEERFTLSMLWDPSLRGAILFALITGLIYPLVTVGVAQIIAPYRANGSLLKQGDSIIGSALIGQEFRLDQYLHARPSATAAPDPKDPARTQPSAYNAIASTGSNLGPTNQTLRTVVADRLTAYQTIEKLDSKIPVPIDAVTASASGLDPHISIANASLQAPRLAHSRKIALEQVIGLLATHTEPRFFGLWGEPRVNVLTFNLALDNLAPFKPTSSTQNP